MFATSLQKARNLLFRNMQPVTDKSDHALLILDNLIKSLRENAQAHMSYDSWLDMLFVHILLKDMSGPEYMTEQFTLLLHNKDHRDTIIQSAQVNTVDRTPEKPILSSESKQIPMRKPLRQPLGLIESGNTNTMHHD